MRLIALALAAVAALPDGSAAQTIRGDDAARLVFDGRAAVFVANPRAALGEIDRKTLDILVKTNAIAKYYGVIAFSPDEGIASEATQGAFNYHDVNTAAGVALAECNRLRKGARPCIVAGQLLPPGYRQRNFQLSQDATNALGEYREIRGAKAMAVSTSTGSFAVAQGPTALGASVAACNKAAPRNDCRVVLKD